MGAELPYVPGISERERRCGEKLYSLRVRTLDGARERPPLRYHVRGAPVLAQCVVFRADGRRVARGGGQVQGSAPEQPWRHERHQ
eukprot:15039403-Alexandrium_andersonii.AAC.1